MSYSRSRRCSICVLNRDSRMDDSGWAHPQGGVAPILTELADADVSHARATEVGEVKDAAVCFYQHQSRIIKNGFSSFDELAMVLACSFRALALILNSLLLRVLLRAVDTCISSVSNSP
eukprot:7105235-Pyramimonas_sp.AAC.1